MVQKLIAEAADWMPRVATRNNDPQLSYFKLRMLSDFGLQANDKGIDKIARLAMEHTREGFFACRGKLPERPQKGEPYVKLDPAADLWHVSPCNAPMITYGLLALSFKNDAIDRSVEQLRDLWGKESGWFCHLFFVESQFKKVKAGCPMAALMALEVFSLQPELKESRSTKNAYSALHFHKEYGKTLDNFSLLQDFKEGFYYSYLTLKTKIVHERTALA